MYLGYRRGFAKVLLLLAAWIFSMLLSSVLMAYVTGFLENHTPLHRILTERITVQVERIAKQQLGEEVPVEEIRLPQNLLNTLDGLMGEGTSELLGNMGVYDAISGQIAHILINAISYMGILIISLLFFRFMFKVTDIVNLIPVIGGINKFAGLVVGFIQALLLSWLICMLISLISDSEVGRQLYLNIRESRILSYLYHHNLLYAIILK